MEQGSTAHPITRRTLLRGTAAMGVAAAGLAGCAGGGPSAAPGTELTAIADVPVGEAKVIGGSQPVVIAQPTQGQFIGHSAICTHGGCTVGTDGGLRLRCPCHGSTFDAGTGAVTKGPASRPLAEVEITVRGDQIVRG
ncbi:MAG TPA: Rieske (2Fe-2S) protein [Nocardioidaceae bacterium]|nr:Rieske (2Fe-2S) protein [Nocardioidaceae bacterium]HSF25954.1 Rieske (2Fe-2S) protein [Actinomycetes bacterium]